MMRVAIDGGVLCYGWEPAVPEYYTVHGYDETGHYFCDLTTCRHSRETDKWLAQLIHKRSAT
jgi:hypothetical protein